MSLELMIDGLAFGGHGVGRIDGQVCFVAYGVPGDRVRIRVLRRAKNALWAEIEEMISPSPDRVAPICPYFGRCGGCCWQHIAYPVQEHWKQRIVTETLRRIGGVETSVGWASEPVMQFGYRTRARYHAAAGALGFLASGSHTVADVEQCPLCHDRLNAAWARIRELPGVADVEVVVNPEGDDVLVWTESKAIRATFPGTAAFMFDGVPIVNGCFSQASLILNRLLVQATRDAIGKAARLLDLYCGNGNLSLCLTGESRVTGIDHDRRAVQAAESSGKGVYISGGETTFREALRESWDVVLLDPPRTGAKAIMADVGQSMTRAIVYVSCDPATLARDLKTLATYGWKPVRITALDLFPHTYHVETVCRLEREGA